MPTTKIALLGLLAITLPLRPQTPPAPRLDFPQGAGRETVVKVCGPCHGAEVLVTHGRTRAEWVDVITSMVTRGAKGTNEEFAQVLSYLAVNFPPEATAGRGRGSAGAPRPGGMGQGADDKHVVDTAAAGRGKTIYIAECITCHGSNGRGTENGPDLVRSVAILHDRYGNEIGSFLHKGHPMQSGKLSTELAKTEIEDLSHFLHQKVYETLRGGPYSQVMNVLTGDPNAGRAYFNGAGRCNSCHSPTGDLAGIAKKYDPATLQQRFVFPRTVGFGRRGIASSKPVQVTVKPPSGPTVSGVLISLDDFNVSLRDAGGEYHSWKRIPGLRVEKQDPYAAHIALLEEYTDKNIHDVVAYLETLK